MMLWWLIRILEAHIAKIYMIEFSSNLRIFFVQSTDGEFKSLVFLFVTVDPFCSDLQYVLQVEGMTLAYDYHFTRFFIRS